MLPVMVGGSILSREIITIVYRRGAFSAETVDGTAPIFAAYLLCLLFIAIRQVSSRAFYAYGDTKTPMKNSLIGIAINIVLDLSVVKFFGAIGLALATTTANAVISILVLAELKKKNGSIDYIKIKSLVVRIVVACLFMAIAISFGRYFIVSCNLLNLATFGGATMFILLSVVLGSGVYSGCLLLMKTEELLMVIQTILRRKP